MDTLFGLDGVAPHGSDETLLTTVHDNIALSMVRGLLDAENIPYLLRERGSGSAVHIIAGFNMYGTDIFVKQADFDRATELLEAYLNAEDAEIVTDEETKDDIQ